LVCWPNNFIRDSPQRQAFAPPASVVMFPFSWQRLPARIYRQLDDDNFQSMFDRNALAECLCNRCGTRFFSNDFIIAAVSPVICASSASGSFGAIAPMLTRTAAMPKRIQRNQKLPQLGNLPLDISDGVKRDLYHSSGTLDISELVEL